MKKYTFELISDIFRFQAIQVEKVLTTDLNLDQLVAKDDLDEVWDAILEYDYEEEFITPDNCLYFQVNVFDERGKVVYQTRHAGNIRAIDQWDRDELEKSGVLIPEFEGIKDGTYLGRYESIKRAVYRSEPIELEYFDPQELYILQAKYINDEFMGDSCISPITFSYQRGDQIEIEKDRLKMAWEEDKGGRGTYYFVGKVEKHDYWQMLREDQ